MNVDRIVLQNFFYVDMLDEVIPFYYGKNTELWLHVYSEDKTVEVVLQSNHCGDILPIRHEFKVAALQGNKIVISTLVHLESYLKSQGVISVKIMPFNIQ